MLEDEVGPNHPKLGRLLDNAGLANGELGNTDVAIAQLERGRDISAKVYGERSVEVGYSLLNIGVALGTAGRHADAIKRYEVALDVVSSALGPKHPDVALVLNSLGVAYEGLEKFDEAASWYRKALEVTRLQGENHPHVALIIANIGAAELEAGNPRAAITSLADAIKRQEAAGGGTRLVFPLTLHGRAELDANNARGALRSLERAHELLDESEQSANQVGETKFALARALRKSGGDAVRAKALATAARAAYAGTNDPQHARRLAAIDAWLAALP